MVINDDCFNVFSQLEDNSIDAIITDPPYYNIIQHRLNQPFEAKLF
jgi:DNA modification methylase